VNIEKKTMKWIVTLIAGIAEKKMIAGIMKY